MGLFKKIFDSYKGSIDKLKDSISETQEANKKKAEENGTDVPAALQLFNIGAKGAANIVGGINDSNYLQIRTAVPLIAGSGLALMTAGIGVGAGVGSFLGSGSGLALTGAAAKFLGVRGSDDNPTKEALQAELDKPGSSDSFLNSGLMLLGFVLFVVFLRSNNGRN